jgi:hypothetical protein
MVAQPPVDVLLPKQGTPPFVLLPLAAVVPKTVVASSLFCLRRWVFVVQSRDHDRPLDVLQREDRYWWVYLWGEGGCWHDGTSRMDLISHGAY